MIFQFLLIPNLVEHSLLLVEAIPEVEAVAEVEAIAEVEAVTVPSVETPAIEKTIEIAEITEETDVELDLKSTETVVEKIAPAPTSKSTAVTTTVSEKVVEKEIPIAREPLVPNSGPAMPTSRSLEKKLPTPPPTPTTEITPKGKEIFTTMKQRSNFSTLKKDLKKKRSTAGKIYRLENISYDPGGYLLDKAHGEALDKTYKLLKQHQEITIQLTSHTYSVGHDQTNLRLSQNRAKRAAEYLVKKGINPERIFTIGYGETQILNHCINGVACTQAEHAKNERLEIQIMDEAH